MPDSFPAAQSSLSFAKLVATPTEIAWSQAYNAGNLFACIALTVGEAFEEVSLQTLGKALFTLLQSEFSNLEAKNNVSIKQVIQTSLAQIPSEVSHSLTLAFFKDNTLLIFIAGSGKVVMKRDENVGVLLHKENDFSNIISSASGFLKNGDTIVLETGPFAQEITQAMVTQALELTLPTDIVEALSPQMHEQDNGAQAAIIITHRGVAPTGTMIAEELPEETEVTQDQTLGALYKAEEKPQNRQVKLPHFIYFPHLSHRRKLFLSIALILFLLLGVSVFFTLKKKNTDTHQALFQKIYPQAKQDYETGQGLETLNPTLSQENYQKAESLLKDGETKFSKSSKDYQQLDALLAQVENSLHSGTTDQTTPTKAVEPDKNSLLQVEQTTKDGLAFGEDADDVYLITANAISTISKSSGAKKERIKNDNDWSSPQAIVPYQGNVYVLDQKHGVIKFVQGSGGFGKTSYFKEATPDLSQAGGMAIDGSVWLSLKSGTLLQYTKGVSDGLKVTGLPTPMNNPTKIVTDITMEHVYVLDQENNRIIQFDKHGAYQKAYTSPVVGKATDFSVSEKQKELLILSGGKVWEMSL